MNARRTVAAGIVGGGGDRLQHHALQRALAQLAGEQPPQELLLVGRGRAEQGVELLGPARRRARRRRWRPARPAAPRRRDLQRSAWPPAPRRAPASVRQPAPSRPCRGSPVSQAVAGSISSGRGGAQQRGQRRRLRRAGRGWPRPRRRWRRPRRAAPSESTSRVRRSGNSRAIRAAARASRIFGAVCRARCRRRCAQMSCESPQPGRTSLGQLAPHARRRSRVSCSDSRVSV